MRFPAFVHSFGVSTQSFTHLAPGVVFRSIVHFVELTVPREDAIGVTREREKQIQIQRRQRSAVRKLKLQVSCRLS